MVARIEFLSERGNKKTATFLPEVPSQQVRMWRMMMMMRIKLKIMMRMRMRMML